MKERLPIRTHDGRRLTRAQRRMMIKVFRNPGYIPQRGTTKNTVQLLIERSALLGTVEGGVIVAPEYGVDNEGLFREVK